MRRDEAEALPREACCRCMWRAVPKEAEDAIAGEAMASIPDRDMDASPCGELLALAAEAIDEMQGKGAFATAHDEAVAVRESTLDDICVEPGTEAFEQMRRLGYRKRD